jgi:hypothetical protein
MRLICFDVDYKFIDTIYFINSYYLTTLKYIRLRGLVQPSTAHDQAWGELYPERKYYCVYEDTLLSSLKETLIK